MIGRENKYKPLEVLEGRKLFREIFAGSAFPLFLHSSLLPIWPGQLGMLGRRREYAGEMRWIEA